MSPGFLTLSVSLSRFLRLTYLPFHSTSIALPTEKNSLPSTKAPSTSSPGKASATANVSEVVTADATVPSASKEKVSLPSANFSVGTHFHGNTTEDKSSLSSRKVLWSGVTKTKSISSVSSWTKPSSGVTKKKAVSSWSSGVTKSGWKSSSSSWTKSCSFGVTKETDGSSWSSSRAFNFSGVTEKKRDSFVSKFSPNPPSMNRKRAALASPSHDSRKRQKFSHEDRVHALQRLSKQPILNHYIISRTPGVTRRVVVSRKKCIVKDKVR